MIDAIALLAVDMLQSRHVPILNMYNLKPIETKNDMPFHHQKQSMASLFGDRKHIHYQSNESMFVKKSNRLNLKKPSLVR